MSDDYRYIDAYDYVKRGTHGQFYKALDRLTIQGINVQRIFTMADRAAGVGDSTGWWILERYTPPLCTPIQRWLEQERDHENV